MGKNEPSEDDYHRVDSNKNISQQIQLSHQHQEGQLEEMYAGVKRINNHANRVNNEVLGQNHLIDELGQDIEAGTKGLEAQTQVAKDVNAKKKTVCGLYIAIILLIIILVVILAI